MRPAINAFISKLERLGRYWDRVITIVVLYRCGERAYMKRVNTVLATFLNQLFLNSRNSGSVCRSGVRTTTTTTNDGHEDRQ